MWFYEVHELVLQGDIAVAREEIPRFKGSANVGSVNYV